MTASAVAPGRWDTASLDERVLNAGTTQRFVLLLVLFIAESTGVAYDVIARLVGVSASQGVVATLVPYAVSVVLIAVAVCLYWSLPKWKGRRSRVLLLEEVDDGGRLCRELDNLVGLANLRARPRFLVDPGAATAGAVVFGTSRETTVRLNAGLVVGRSTDPRRFRAVVLHEFAHIHNRDIGITYGTVAMWRVLLVAVLIPQAVLIVATGLAGAGTVGASVLVQEALIVLMVYLTRADILRTREIYADRTAVRLWGVPADSLVPRHGLREDHGRRALSSFFEAWHTHPSWRLRARSLTSPDELFTLRALPLFVTGMAADIAAVQLAAPFGSLSSWLRMGQFLLISGLVTGVGGVALWRAIVHAVLTGRRTPSGWTAGLALGAGLAAGELTNTVSNGGRLLPAHPEVLAILVILVAVVMAWTAQYAELRVRTYRGESLNLAMVGGLVPPTLVLSFVQLWWHNGAWVMGWHLSVGAELAHAGLPADHPPALLTLLAALTALPGSDLGFNGLWWSVPLLWLVPLQLWLLRTPRPLPRWLVRFMGVHSKVWRLVSSLLVVFVGIVLVSMGPVGYLLLAAPVWAFVVMVLRARRAPASYWLDQAKPGSTPPAADLPELRWAVRIGVLGGLASCAGLLAEPLATRAGRVFHSWQVNSELDLAWIIVVISTVMIVVAAIAALVIGSHYSMITALIAAGIAAVIGIAFQCVKGVVDGCLGPLNNLATACHLQPIRFLPLAEYTLGYVLAPALLLAALVAALARAGRALLRRGGGLAVVPTGHRQVARPMRGVSVLNAVAVCLVVGVTAYQTITVVAPLPRSDLLVEYETSPTGPVRTGVSPTADWMRYVGDTIRKYGSGLGAVAGIRDGLRDNADHVRYVREAAPKACAAFADIAEHAEENARLYNPAIPDDAERLWTRFLGDVRTTLADCLALGQATTDAAILDKLGAINVDANATVTDARALVNWINHAAGH